MSNEKLSAQEKIMNRVKKLLNLSTNNPNENEAQSALLFAQKMMAENNINMSDIEGYSVTKEVKKEIGESSTVWAKNQWYHKDIAWIIADNFRCYHWYRPSNGMSKIVFFGLKSDAELAKEMFNFAITAMEYNTDKYIEEQRELRYIRDSKPLRTDYMKGFVRGLREKFKAQAEMKITKVENGKQVLTTVALALVKDNAVVEAHDKMKFKKAAASRGGRNGAGDKDAYAAGREKGQAFEAASGYLK